MDPCAHLSPFARSSLCTALRLTETATATRQGLPHRFSLLEFYQRYILLGLDVMKRHDGYGWAVGWTIVPPTAPPRLWLYAPNCFNFLLCDDVVQQTS
jgi:hypothetical protein